MSRWTLSPDQIPTAWFNVAPHLPTPLQPPLHPATREPIGPEDLAPLFPMALIGQEVSAEPWIDVPGEVLDILRLWRPTPLVRAVRLERALGTPARIYFKDESVSPAGSHKPNTAVPQAFYNKAEGITRLATETGAGQWGTALAFACAQFDLECKVYMVRASYQQKPYRKVIMETWGGSVVPSPVDDPDHPGSLGAAISDAVRDAVGRADTHYALGSVLNHVLLHQTVIGLEAKEQLALAGERLPDVVIAPCGGGSNLGGISFPFVPDANVRLVAVEPLSCPTLTQGKFDYDFGDTAGLTPLLPMYTLGHDFVPPPIHAGGLRYHGDSPIISALVRDRRMEAVAYPQGKVFEAAVQFARAEGKVAAPEAAHAIRAVIDEALAAKETGEEKVILFNYCGHGFLDLSAYDDYLSGRLPDEQGG
ncbi:MAG TPA: TrpB-like pyridoxal phosphate-dependent enzyme [Pseudonocardia sp.]|jgi:tryptophan synthase beta chain|nr:TrpB-like pyridoxal phosphate-dependent enzyme [Pseudonocardia sp.]HTF49860.1 TrpB-like pyridoxal phosphate-dependent enzyme [Pseudonocardia sp.]